MLDAHHSGGTYVSELHDQPRVALSLKTRMVKAEAIETLLYGDAGGGPSARNTTPNSAPYTTTSLASHHRGMAQETRPPDDLVQPCP